MTFNSNMNLNAATVLLTMTLLTNNAYGGELLGLFGKKEELVFAFSGFSGQLLYQGEPAAGAVITRSYDQMGEGEVIESVVADEQGRFNFVSIALKFKPPVFSTIDYISSQEMRVVFNNEQFSIWNGGKRSKVEFGEFNGRPKNFTCELTGEKRSIRFKLGGFVGTSCHWEVCD